MTEYNVLAQIENLKTHPSVRIATAAADEIEIRGWVYDIGDGSMREANPASGQVRRDLGVTAAESPHLATKIATLRPCTG